jgi:hypothetical protein
MKKNKANRLFTCFVVVAFVRISWLGQRSGLERFSGRRPARTVCYRRVAAARPEVVRCHLSMPEFPRAAPAMAPAMEPAEAMEEVLAPARAQAVALGRGQRCSLWRLELPWLKKVPTKQLPTNQSN